MCIEIIAHVPTEKPCNFGLTNSDYYLLLMFFHFSFMKKYQMMKYCFRIEIMKDRHIILQQYSETEQCGKCQSDIYSSIYFQQIALKTTYFIPGDNPIHKIVSQIKLNFVVKILMVLYCDEEIKFLVTVKLKLRPIKEFKINFFRENLFLYD